jgi:hypothetical protein
MRDLFFSFIMEVIGVFIVWAFKGFKGKFNDEMSRPYESGTKSWRNSLISIGFVIIVLVVINKISDRQKEDNSDNKIEYIIKD